jgi:hypothetical protein
MYAALKGVSEDASKYVACAFLDVCSAGDFAMARWLHTLCDPDVRIFDSCALHCVCRYGHLEMAQWMHATVAFTITDVRDHQWLALGAL